MKLLPFITAILIIIEIIFTNQFAGTGTKMRQTDAQIDILRQENALLEQKVASASSLSTIENQATGMGFVKPSKSQYLTVTTEFPVAVVNSR